MVDSQKFYRKLSSFASFPYLLMWKYGPSFRYKWRATIFLKIVHFSNLLRAMTNMDYKIIFILAVASIIFENISIVTGAPMHKEVQLS